MFYRLYWYRVPRTMIISVGLAGILGGIVWARFGASTTAQLTAISFLLIPLTAKRRWPVLTVAVLIGLNIGLWRGNQVFTDLDCLPGCRMALSANPLCAV